MRRSADHREAGQRRVAALRFELCGINFPASSGIDNRDVRIGADPQRAFR